MTSDMVESPAMSVERTELASSEKLASREQVVDAFNNATYRWEMKINRLHREINPRVEIDDLADTTLLTDDQRRQFAEFRTFEKGVRGLTGNGMMAL